MVVNCGACTAHVVQQKGHRLLHTQSVKATTGASVGSSTPSAMLLNKIGSAASAGTLPAQTLECCYNITYDSCPSCRQDPLDVRVPVYTILLKLDNLNYAH